MFEAVLYLCVAGICAVIGIMGLLQKGPIVSLQYFRGTAAERKRLRTRKHYLLNGVTYLALFAFFVFMGLGCLFAPDVLERLFLPFGIVIAAVIVVGNVVVTLRPDEDD